MARIPPADRHGCSSTLLSGAVYLSDKELSVSLPRFSGDLASGITPDEKPHTLGSSTIGQRIVDTSVLSDSPGVAEGSTTRTRDL